MKLQPMKRRNYENVSADVRNLKERKNVCN